MMRVTSNGYAELLSRQLNTLAGRQYRLQNQVATGQRVSLPEEDAAAVQRALGLRAQESRLTQFRQNITSLQERATAAYHSLRAVQTVSNRAGELATLADGTRSREELQTYAVEVSQLIQQAAQVLNNKHREGYLFGGTSTGAAPFTVTTDAEGFVTGVSYSGNARAAEAEIDSGAAMTVDVPGENTTGAGPRGLVADARSGADFFNHLIALQDHLRTGNTGAIADADRAALRRDEDNFIYHLGSNGAIQTRLEAAASAAGARMLALREGMTNETGADLTESIVQLSRAQTAYQAALSSGAGILKMSLMDYLR